jgi:hypothetical protein
MFMGRENNMNFPIISLNAGKFTGKIDTRSDTEKYASGCRELQNMIPLIYGPVERRPGTKYIADCQDDNVKSRLLPFIYSADIAYYAEFSDKIINTYFGESLVEGNIVSPYLEADLFGLQFKQSADVMWLTHNTYNPRQLSRVSASDFDLAKISFENGPFIKRNDLSEKDGVSIAVTGYTIATATAATNTITISSTTDISSQFPVNQRFYITASTGNDGAYTVLSSSWVANTLTVVSNEDFTDNTNDGQVMVDGASVTLTASSGTFVTGSSGHVDSLWKLTHKRLKTVAKGSGTGTGVIGDSIDVKGNWTFTTTGNWDATVEIQRLADSTNWETFRTYVSTISAGQGSFNAQKSDIEEDDGVQYRINVTEYNSGTVESTFTVNNSTQDSIFKITGVTTTSTAIATAIVAAPDNVAAKRWAEGAWSNVRGWPTAINFFEERAVYGFTNSDTRDVWLSGTNEFEDFETGTNANDAFSVTLPTANRGRWIGSSEALTAGTSGDEWRIMSTNFSEGLTPENASIKLQTSVGSTSIQAAEVNEALIFIDAVARKVREFTWNDGKQKFVSPDLTALAEDIADGGITSIAVQKRPDSIVWFTIANSPYLLSMTYEREQNVVAFAEHPLGGNGITESVVVTPGVTEDVITLTVKRTINGSTKRTIEQMQPRDWGNDTDIFFVDAGIIDTSGSKTITGLEHLEGETVQVIVDGAQQSDKVVSLGQITIDKAGTRVVVGLPYEYKGSPMRLDTNTANGTTHGSLKNIHELVISFYKTLNAKYGDGTKQYDINWRTTENYDNPPNLFTGDIGSADDSKNTINFDGGFSIKDTIVISGTDPFPCTVRAIIPRLEVTGR